ncbi:FecR domain-containing protein [Flavitalea sp. BT771]|uniref:FecR family protein n=1 Tax=Flavitalea sp. BT771 TaxID=3063329 RepID=UPI0026E354C1|nr:FecR family protein [Flavitalea sp. BT771]MDO6431963.1 FecR domain-containing protein [Flavitalea sp. BT771]MDV6220872.1 FecR domain-containing protein [Flavitalea sp. BT771]
MEERKDHIKRLIKRWMENTITLEEKGELAGLLNEQTLLSDVEPGLQEMWDAQTSQHVLSERETASMIEHILSNNRPEGEIDLQAPVRRIHAMPRWGWAAAAIIIIIILGMGGLLRTINKNDAGTRRTAVHPPATEVMPAMGKVVLKLPDGQQLYLDSLHGSIVKKGALTVDSKKGSLTYKGAAGKMEYHTLTVPRGRQYELELPDGTNVWLNAASSITYPIVFGGPERLVTVSGEAYFEVAKDKSKPFRVAANDMMITVTGTHFNVNAYGDEPYFATTVLEGGVKVTRNSKTVILSPNEQSISDVTGSLSVNRNVNVDDVMAWRDRFFHFESADLPTILRELARWYDVDVAYEGVVSKERFFAIINRNSSLSAVLKALQANDVQFNINGKKLTVKSSK